MPSGHAEGLGSDAVKYPIIDEICVGWGDDVYELLTASHENETLEEAVKFAESLDLEFKGPVQIVEC